MWNQVVLPTGSFLKHVLKKLYCVELDELWLLFFSELVFGIMAWRNQWLRCLVFGVVVFRTMMCGIKWVSLQVYFLELAFGTMVRGIK